MIELRHRPSLPNRCRAIPALIFSASAWIPAASYAQNSVTLYGVLDTSIGYVTNAGGTSAAHRVGFVNSNIQSSGFGVKGKEDLGGGLSAIFDLQSIIVPTSGALAEKNTLFSLQSWVGLASDQYGTLTFGRQYDPITDLLEPLTADIDFGALFATVGNVDNYDALLHINDSIKYVSPTLAGFTFEAMASLNGVAGSVSAGSVYSAAVSYTNGALSLAGGYMINRVDNQTVLTGGTPSVTASTSADGLNYDNPIVQFANIRSNEIGRLGGQYSFGPLAVGAAYSNSRFHQFDSNATLNFNSGSAFLHYMPGPLLGLAAGYSFTRATGGGAGANYNQVSLGSDYFLSKRTDIYVSAVYQHASGDTLSNADALVPATASVGDEGFYGTGRSQFLSVVGMRHRF
ncbi:porin [Paraburkholderia acidipaludis]|uniref:porin n=1 Tax=Paraburkholderia acidipaludis TaxID=660537 RepID=UPI0009FD9020|nr:porin [Paraburkholderia acidipaludis]